MEKKIDLGIMSYDRITDLPEHLRQHILSFLPIKYAAQTSILSRDWRMVWTGLRCLRTLDFSDKYLPSSLTEEGSAFHFRSTGWVHKGDEANQAIVRMRKDYYSFLYRVFGYVTELEELKLYVPGFGFGLIHCVDHWLDRAVACGVKYLELKIALSISNRYILPGCVLGSKSIVKLVLKNCWLLNLSSFMGTQLPSLREIWFDDVSIDEKGIGIILGICINLESLYLRNCFEWTRLEISNLTPSYKRGVLLFVPMKDAVIPEDVRLKVRPPLHGVKHLMVEIRVSKRHGYDFVSVNDDDLVDSLLWLAPCLESLRVSNLDDKIVKLFKFTYEKPIRGKKKCGCWKSLAINCWRHSLTNVSLEYELGDEDDTQLAEFFRNARLDGKMVILSRLPRLK